MLPGTRKKRIAGAALIVFPLLAAIVGITADAGGALNTLAQLKDRFIGGKEKTAVAKESLEVPGTTTKPEVQRLTGVTGQKGNSQFLEVSPQSKYLPKGTMAADVRRAIHPYLVDDKKCQQFFASKFRGKSLPAGGWTGKINLHAAQTAEGSWWVSISEDGTQADVIAVSKQNLSGYAIGDRIRVHGVMQTGCTKWIVVINSVVSIQK